MWVFCDFVQFLLILLITNVTELFGADGNVPGRPSGDRRALPSSFWASSCWSLSTTLEILTGWNLVGTDNLVIMQVRELIPTAGNIISDVLNLANMVNNPDLIAWLVRCILKILPHSYAVMNK